MKIGLNAWTFPQNLSIPQGIRIAKRAGFDAIELNLCESGYLHLDSTDEEILKLRQAAENMTIELLSLSTGLFWQYPLTSNDPEVRAKSMDIVRTGLRISRMLGADTFLVVPGIVTDDVPYDVAYERSLEALKQLAEDAERERVYIGVENVWNKFLLSPLEMRDFIDAVGSSCVAAYFDIGNAMVAGYPEQWIRILGSRIRKIHAKDYAASIGPMGGSTNLLQGDVDWPAVKSALKEVGYDGLVTGEVPCYSALPDLGIRHIGESMKRLFKNGSISRDED